MRLGFFLIVLGILIALRPQVLVGLIAGGLIASGVFLCVISWRWRKMKRRTDSAFVSWVTRF